MFFDHPKVIKEIPLKYYKGLPDIKIILKYRLKMNQIYTNVNL